MGRQTRPRPRPPPSPFPTPIPAVGSSRDALAYQTALAEFARRALDATTVEPLRTEAALLAHQVFPAPGAHGDDGDPAHRENQVPRTPASPGDSSPAVLIQRPKRGEREEWLSRVFVELADTRAIMGRHAPGPCHPPCGTGGSPGPSSMRSVRATIASATSVRRTSLPKA
jgi:hypothetical protein